MMKDVLQAYASLRAQLLAERETIEKRLTALDAVLGTGGINLPSVVTPSNSTSDDATTYAPRKGTLPAKILGTLENGGAAMQVKDIAAAVKKSPPLVNQACLVLMKKRLVKREGRGQYSLA